MSTEGDFSDETPMIISGEDEFLATKKEESISNEDRNTRIEEVPKHGDDQLPNNPTAEDKTEDQLMAEKEKNLKTEDDELSSFLTTDSDGYLDLLGSGDLKKRVIREGEKNTRAERGSWVTVRIVGKLKDGAVVEKHDQLAIIIGDMDVVQGLDMAIALMHKGEIAEVIVAPRLAYGSVGKTPEIPPDAELHYEVELLSIKEDVDELSLPLEERIKIGDEKRDRGNFWYGREAYSSAIHCYRRAIDFLDEEEENLRNPTDQVQQLIDLRVKVHNNLAAAQLKVEAYDAALKSVEWVLKIQPKNVKALFRRGKIFAAKGMTDQAIADMKAALQIDPESKIIHQELSKLVSQKRAEAESEKALYKRMFQQDKVKSKTTSNKRHGLIMLAGAVLIAAISVAVYYHITAAS